MMSSSIEKNNDLFTHDYRGFDSLVLLLTHVHTAAHVINNFPYRHTQDCSATASLAWHVCFSPLPNSRHKC